MSRTVPAWSIGIAAAAAVVGFGLPASQPAAPAVSTVANTTVLAGYHHHSDDGDDHNHYDHSYQRADHNNNGNTYDYGDNGLIVLHDLL